MDNKNKKLTPEDFIKAYEELCLKTGYMWSIAPVWVNRDDGTFSMVIKRSIEKLPEVQNESKDKVDNVSF